MKPDKSDKTELKTKQKFYLYFYKSQQYLYGKWFYVREKIRKIPDSFVFYLISFGVFAFLFHEILTYLDLTISKEDMYSLSFAAAGIIGASIAIIFSFSTFILQSTSDLFSTQYLNKFIEDAKEKTIFWLLVILTITAFLTPIFIKKYSLEAIVLILLVAFYLIYTLYKDLRRKMNPETTLIKIKTDAIKQLVDINNEFKKHSHIQNKIFEYEKEEKEMSLDLQYKMNQSWHLIVLENVKYLFEIGLRLLSKNEINSSNLTLKFIHDVYLKHLDLRSGYFVRLPSSFWGSYSSDDEGFTARILEYLQSIGDRVIQEKRKENIYYLLRIYESILKSSLSIKYADNDPGTLKGNPLFNLVLTYYIGFIEKLLKSKEIDWIWESIKSVSTISNLIMQKTDDYFLCSQLNQILDKLAVSCFSENQETFLKELVNIYFNQIRISWNRYENNAIFWKDLFKELKKDILLLSVVNDRGLSISELFINFHSWQVIVINSIIEEKEKKNQEKALDKFVKHLELWSDFLLDLARDTGLENRQIGLPIIQSIENNLKIVYGIESKFKDADLEKIHRTQFNSLSWYFQKTNNVDESFLLNLEQVLEILLIDIRDNLKKDIFDIESVISLYIRLVEQHFEKATPGYGYNHPRIIERLVYLGLILHKYKKTSQEKKVVSKMNELNDKYLELNKDYFKLKQAGKNISGPNEFQLCKEISNLRRDVFSLNAIDLMDMRHILRQEITENDWNNFIKQIKYCEGIEYKTTSNMLG